jgi:hypothetical protein
MKQQRPLATMLDIRIHESHYHYIPECLSARRNVAGAAVDHWTTRLPNAIDHETPTMTLKRSPNRWKQGPNPMKEGQCYVSFGLNGAIFHRNSFDAKQLSLWWVPTINKGFRDKDLSSILAGGPPSICRKSLLGLQLLRCDILAQNRLCITNYNNCSFAVCRGSASDSRTNLSARPVRLIECGA